MIKYSQTKTAVFLDSLDWFINNSTSPRSDNATRKSGWRQQNDRWTHADVINETDQGKTILWTSQNCQTPKTQYGQSVQWDYSSSYHEKRYQNWHHSAWRLDAQMKGHVSGPSNHLTSPERLSPFLNNPKEMPGLSQF